MRVTTTFPLSVKGNMIAGILSALNKRYLFSAPSEKMKVSSTHSFPCEVAITCLALKFGRFIYGKFLPRAFGITTSSIVELYPLQVQREKNPLAARQKNTVLARAFSHL